MSAALLLLPAPYGLGSNGIHASIRAPNSMSKKVAEIAENFGCPKFISPKVESCIRHSGRYDCILMPDVELEMLKICIELIDGSVEAIHMDEFEFHSSSPSLSHYLMNKYGSWDFGIENGSFGILFSVDYDAIREKEGLAVSL